MTRVEAFEILTDKEMEYPSPMSNPSPLHDDDR